MAHGPLVYKGDRRYGFLHTKSLLKWGLSLKVYPLPSRARSKIDIIFSSLAIHHLFAKKLMFTGFVFT